MGSGAELAGSAGLAETRFSRCLSWRFRREFALKVVRFLGKPDHLVKGYFCL